MNNQYSGYHTIQIAVILHIFFQFPAGCAPKLYLLKYTNDV